MRPAIPLTALLASALLCCARDSAPLSNPLSAPPVEIGVSEAEVLAWPYRQETSADLDGDGSAEVVILAADVSFSTAGVPLWEDGHRWAVVIQDRDRPGLAYAAFVPRGRVEAAVLQPSSEGKREVLVQERTPERTRALTLAYDAPGKIRSVSAAHYQVETWLPDARPGIRFDPGTLRPGARVGSLVVQGVEARRAVDGSWVGTARFAGELKLTGRRRPHRDPELGAVCFEADEASAAALPRWPADTRLPWFCFDDAEAARRLLPDAAAEAHPLTAIVDGFTIHRGLSDEVNAAHLVRVQN